MTQQIKWDWYGTWVVDWLTCEKDDFSISAFEGFDIWKKAYCEANPEFSEVSDLDLILNHYSGAMEPVFNSWVFAAWRLLHWPSMVIHLLIWTIKCKFF